MSKELEIKVLNVDIVETRNKLEELGCKYIGENIQKLYVYDVLTIKGLYNSIISDWHDTSTGMQDVILSRFKQLILEVNSVISMQDSKELCRIFNAGSILELRESVKKSDEIYKKLQLEEVSKIFNSYGVNQNKWIRLRETGNKATITIKHILDNKNVDIGDGINQYGLHSIEEVEMQVESIEIGKNILEQLGFYHRNYQEKKRVSYIYEPLNVEIEIDSWPLIPPYIEIEGKSEQSINKMVELLGYSISEVLVANTSAVYQKYGIDIYSYKELKFKEE